MKRTLLFCGVFFFGLSAGLMIYSVRAQGTGPAVTTVFGGAAGDHTHCGPVAALGSASMCLATDGIWQSVNGGPWTQLGASGPAVVTINGKTQSAFTITGTATAPAAVVTPPAISSATTIGAVATPGVSVAAPAINIGVN
jgi:hypothetical protein